MNIPMVSIGLPVYNGEMYLRRAINSLLAQTFTDFELIISDNHSTDKTEDICRDYMDTDGRIVYIRQDNNIGAVANFEFVLKKSRGCYFMWAASDDFWHPSFITKNYQVLETNPSVVASISKVRMQTIINKNPKLVGTFPLDGNYIARLRKYLKSTGANSRFYSIYRASIIKQSFCNEKFMGGDFCIVVNMLKYGGFYEIDEILMERSCGGASSKLLTEQFNQYGIKGLEQVFPLLRFTIWLLDNLGSRIFFICTDCLLTINIFYFLVIVSELLGIRKSKISICN